MGKSLMEQYLGYLAIQPWLLCFFGGFYRCTLALIIFNNRSEIDEININGTYGMGINAIRFLC